MDHVLIADHRSVDGTREALLDRSRGDSRVHVVLDEQEGHFQKEKVTRLARAAWQAGARWIIPFDADELWFARDATLRGFFDDWTGAIVTAKSINAVPLGSSRISCSSEFILADKEAASKVAVQSHPLVMIGPGNHGAARVGASAQGLFIGHIPYRNAEQVSQKYRNGARALDAAGAPDFEGWH